MTDSIKINRAPVPTLRAVIKGEEIVPESVERYLEEKFAKYSAHERTAFETWRSVIPRFSGIITTGLALKPWGDMSWYPVPSVLSCSGGTVAQFP